MSLWPGEVARLQRAASHGAQPPTDAIAHAIGVMETLMLDSLFNKLPPDIRDDIHARNTAFIAFMGPLPGTNAISVDLVSKVEEMTVRELGEAHAMMTHASGSLGVIAAFLTSIIRWLELFLRIRAAEVRTALRASGRACSSQELDDAVQLDARAGQIQEGLQGFANMKLAVEGKQRAYAAGADATSRALTARQIDLAQLKLEVRGA